MHAVCSLHQALVCHRLYEAASVMNQVIKMILKGKFAHSGHCGLRFDSLVEGDGLRTKCTLVQNFDPFCTWPTFRYAIMHVFRSTTLSPVFQYLHVTNSYITVLLLKCIIMLHCNFPWPNFRCLPFQVLCYANHLTSSARSAIKRHLQKYARRLRQWMTAMRPQTTQTFQFFPILD